MLGPSFQGSVVAPKPFMSNALDAAFRWLHPPNNASSKGFYIGALAGTVLSISSAATVLYYMRRNWDSGNSTAFNETPIDIVKNEVVSGVPGLVGWSPRLDSSFTRISHFRVLKGIRPWSA